MKFFHIKTIFSAAKMFSNRTHCFHIRYFWNIHMCIHRTNPFPLVNAGHMTRFVVQSLSRKYHRTKTRKRRRILKKKCMNNENRIGCILVRQLRFDNVHIGFFSDHRIEGSLFFWRSVVLLSLCPFLHRIPQETFKNFSEV